MYDVLTETIYFFAAYSACGHVAYMLVRMGPVFRIGMVHPYTLSIIIPYRHLIVPYYYISSYGSAGSLYFPEEVAASRWAALTDTQRLTELLSLKHPWFLLELGILFVACVYFLLIRVQLLLYGAV